MLRKYFCEAACKVTLRPVDPVLIKSGYASLGSVDMEPVRIATRPGQRPVPYFPGTSLKGVFRSHVERIARTLKPGSVCLPYYDPGRKLRVPDPEEEKSYGCSYRDGDRGTSDEAYSNACAACRMFGSLKFAGRFSVSDAYPEREPLVVRRNGVGICRMTGGTVRGVLFDLEAVSGGEFTTTVRLVNFEPYQLAALYFLLLDLTDQMLTIGMGASRGFGRVEAEVKKLELYYTREVKEILCLGDLADDADVKAYKLQRWRPDGAVALPSGARRGLRWHYDISNNWQELLDPFAPAFAEFLEFHPQPLGNRRGG